MDLRKLFIYRRVHQFLRRNLAVLQHLSVEANMQDVIFL